MLRWLGVFLVLAALALPLVLLLNRTTNVFLAVIIAVLALGVIGLILLLRPPTPQEAAEGLIQKDLTGSAAVIGGLVALVGLAIMFWRAV